MNHTKTFIFYSALTCLFASSLAFGSLNRDLKPNEISALQSNVQRNPENLKSRLFLGHHYFRVGDFNNVIEYLSPMTESLPDDALFKLAKSYLEINKYRDAESLANILLSKEKIRTKHYLLAANILAGILDTAKLDPYPITEKKGKKEVTIMIDPRKPVLLSLFNTLKDAQKSDPSNPKVYEVWLDMLESYEDNYAIDGLRVLDDMKKNKVAMSPKFYTKECKYAHFAEYTRQAKIACQKAIEKDPNNPSNYIYLGQTHVDVGEEKVGKRMLASVGKKFSDSEEALWATADSYYQSKNVSAAYTYFKKASQHKDAQARDFLGLGITAFELKKYREALSSFVRHCQISGVSHQEFRKASGLLKDNLKLQEIYRQKMLDCKQK